MELTDNFMLIICSSVVKLNFLYNTTLNSTASRTGKRFTKAIATHHYSDRVRLRLCQSESFCQVFSQTYRDESQKILPLIARFCSKLLENSDLYIDIKYYIL